MVWPRREVISGESGYYEGYVGARYYRSVERGPYLVLVGVGRRVGHLLVVGEQLRYSYRCDSVARRLRKERFYLVDVVLLREVDGPISSVAQDRDSEEPL